MARTISKPFVFGIVVAGQICIFGLLAWLSYERTVEQEKARLTLDARATAEQIAYAMRLVDVQIDHLQALAHQSPGWTEELGRDSLEAFTKAADSAPHILGAGIADNKGVARLLARTGDPSKVSGLDLSQRSYFTVQRDGLSEGSFMSEPIVSRVSGRWLLVVSRRLSTPEGAFRGIVMLAVDPWYFAEKFALLGDLPIARRVLTGNGALIAISHPSRNDQSAVGGETPGTISPQRLTEAQVFWEAGTQGRDVLTAVAPVSGWPLVATATMDRAAIFSNWKASVLGKGLALSLSLAAMLTLILVIYRQQDQGTKMQSRFRALIEESADGVIIHDLGQVLFANDASAQILGLYHGTELRGRSLSAFLSEEQQGEALARWRKVKETGQPVTVRRVLVNRVDGEPIFLDVSSQAIDWGEKSAIRSSLSEVTDQVLMTARDERRTTILSAVNDAHSIYLNQTRNRAAFEDLLEKILDLSGSVYGLIAEKLEDEDGKPYLRTLAISNIAWDAETRAWHESAETGGMEFRNIDNLRGVPLRTGEIVIANDPRQHPASTGVPCGHLSMDNVMLLPLALEDEILGEVALANRPGGFDQKLADELGPIVQAITRIVADYRSVRLREAAEEASRSKSAFLAHMSHELRTPLAGVIANLELLGGTTLEREQADLVDASMSAGKALLGVIGNTLDFSKIEADELILDITAFDPAAMVDVVRSIFFAAAQDKGLTLSTLIDATVPKTVVADEMRLRQVLANLIGNSLKFTDSGRVAVSLSSQAIDEGYAQLCLSVDDTGVGFDPQKAESLFKPFGQENNSTARQFGGTGLGLTIAQRLVALHDGEIKCHSQPGAGSSFVVSLPVAVEHWGNARVQPMQDETVIFFFPKKDLPPELVASLESAGAEVVCVSEVAALRAAPATPSERRRSLVIDWESVDRADLEAIETAHSGDFTQIFAAAPCCDPDHWRQILFHDGLRPIAKPLSAINVSHAVLGEDYRQADPDDDPAVPDPGGYLVFDPGKAPRILVVEDQPMNQLVLRRQLRRLGADCDLAENGRDALEILDRGSYDVVITDCSMPVMDGFELSVAIRDLEAGGRPRSAIIALTANAVTGDAQRCYDAGMDAYLSKPVGLSELSRALEQWWHPSLKAGETRIGEEVRIETPEPAAATPQTMAVESSEEPPVDRSAIAELIGEDDEETINALILDFFDNWQVALFALHDPWARQDGRALREAAHAAKGTARYGMASVLAGICERLEQQAEAADWDGLRRLIETLEAETDRLQVYLTTSGLIRDDEQQSA